MLLLRTLPTMQLKRQQFGQGICAFLGDLKDIGSVLLSQLIASVS